MTPFVNLPRTTGLGVISYDRAGPGASTSLRSNDIRRLRKLLPSQNCIWFVHSGQREHNDFKKHRRMKCKYRATIGPGTYPLSAKSHADNVKDAMSVVICVGIHYGDTENWLYPRMPWCESRVRENPMYGLKRTSRPTGLCFGW